MPELMSGPTAAQLCQGLVKVSIDLRARLFPAGCLTWVTSVGARIGDSCYHPAHLSRP
jgi:hypothetical protein